MLKFRNPIFPDLKCQEHGIYDVFPCPWPSCKNGIPENCFGIEALIEGEAPEVYSRREWKSISGDAYFSWESSSLPNWFSASKVVWNEARRQKLVDTDSGNLVYHYTSVEGFFGIVQNKHLWLSDYSYLNDTRELAHGIELVAEVTRELLSKESRPQAVELLEQWISKLESPIHRVCIASFSGTGDSLSQWRAYGPIAIGFEPVDISMHAYRATLRPVEYQRIRQRALVQIHLHHMCEAFIVDAAKSCSSKILDAYSKTDRIVELVAFFKDPAFSAEEEYRLAFIEHPDLMPSFGLKCSPKRFRVSRGRIIPYVLSNELEPKLTSAGRELKIREIILGPGTDATLERGVRELLTEMKMDGITVKRSVVPYRT